MEICQAYEISLILGVDTMLALLLAAIIVTNAIGSSLMSKRKKYRR